MVILYIVLILFMGFDLKLRVEDEQWNYQSLLLIQGVVTLTMTITLIISRQRLYFADILGPVLMISCSVSIMIANLSDIFEDSENLES